MLSHSVVFASFCDSMDWRQPGSSVHGDSPCKNTGVGCHAFLHGIFLTQGWNPGLPHCRQILYHLTFYLLTICLVCLWEREYLNVGTKWYCIWKSPPEYSCVWASVVSQKVKKSSYNTGDLGSIPGLERSPGGRHGNPLQYSCLENSYGQRCLAG